MASITIRNFDDSLKERLRIRAAHQGHSMEEEVRYILRAELTKEYQPAQNLAQAIRQRFAPFGGVDLPKIERDTLRNPPSFD
jgi:plasmid stability protein